MRTKNERKSGRSGFTLVEMLLVITIMAILATVVLVSVGRRGDDARKAAARTSIAGLCTAIDTYEMDCGSYPSSLQALITSSGEPNWKGPYIKSAEIPVDQWGTPFGYTPRENGYEVRSAGPDKAMNTADNITN